MNVEMLPIQIIGLKTDLFPMLHTLRNLGCVHIDPLEEMSEVSVRPLTLDRESLREQEANSFLLARVEGLLDALGGASTFVKMDGSPNLLAEAHSSVESLLPQVQSLIAQREKLQSELTILPRYETILLKLLPIIPASAQETGNTYIGILVNRAHVAVLDAIAKKVLELTYGLAEVVSSDVDSSTRAMLFFFPRKYTAEVENLLGKEDVSRLRLPEGLEVGPPDAVLEALHRRMGAIPEEILQVDHELAELSQQWREKLTGIREALRDEVEANSVLNRFGETDITFVMVGWIPADSLDKLKSSLVNSLGESFLIQTLPMTADLRKRAPIILKNPKPVQPFESLVKILSIPRFGHIDPSGLMALFMPIFFGLMVGDIGYGLLMLGISLFFLRKLKSGVASDILKVLAVGSCWTIVFGILFGELFGTLGEELGIHPIWIDRAGVEDVANLLGMTLAVGATHITLGLILGVWEAIRDRSRNHLLERGGMLIGIISLFLLVGVLLKVLPNGFMTPAVAGMIIGIVVLGSSLGWLGILLGPIEFIGLIGNVLSYLRIAAIGLASVYLAKVANDIAGNIGNLVVGVIIAVLIHALNLALGVFSPTIHSLRLQYVEFFRKFYEGGGRLYEPYKSRL
jgi:V/A-type H+-transporting ATPase subunit I